MYHMSAVFYIVGFFAVLLSILWLAWHEHLQDEKNKKVEAELDRMERARRHREIREAIRQQKLDQLNEYLFEEYKKQNETEEREAK